MDVKYGLRSLPEAQHALPATRTIPVPDGFIEYITAGSGSPTIVLLNGSRTSLGTWALVLPHLAEISTVFAYNRAGVGGSAKPRMPQTGSVVVNQLREVLTAAHLAAPYVLVGTATGGLYANLYARTFPRDVAGVVLLTSHHPDDDALQRFVRFIPRPVARMSMAIIGSDRNSEEACLPQTSAEIAQAGPFPDVPVAVLSSTVTAGFTTSPDQASNYWARQEELVRLSPRGEHITAATSSYIPHISDPVLVVQTIRDTVAASRPTF